MASKIWRNLIRTAAAACFVVGSSAQAGGVFYQSDFDPIGFAGSAEWRVDENCNISGLGDGYYGVNQFASAIRFASGCSVSLSKLSVSLWEGGANTLAGARLANDRTLVTVEFPSEPEVDPKLVAGIFVRKGADGKGALAGVDTFMIGPQPFDNDDSCPNQNATSCGGTIDQDFGIQFTSGHDPVPGFLANFSGLPSWLLGGIPAALGNLGVDYGGAFLWEQGNYPVLNAFGKCPRYAWTFLCEQEVVTGTADGNYAGFTNRNADGTFPFPTRFEPIPEPGSLALLGSALVAGWITRRRKTAA